MQALQSTACSEVQKAFILQEIKAKVIHKFSLKPKPVDVCINEDTFRSKPFFVTKKLDGYRCFVYFRICKFQEYQFMQIYVVDSKHNVQFLCNSNIKPTTLKSIVIDAEKVDNRFYLFGIHNSKLNLIQQLGYIQLFLKEMKLSKMGFLFETKQFFDNIPSAKQSYKHEKNDGLVLTSIDNKSYKYKPIEKITTDFRLNVKDNDMYLTLDDSKEIFDVDFTKKDFQLYEDGDIVECNTGDSITILKKRVDKTTSNSSYVFKRNLDLIYSNINEKQLQAALNDFKKKYWSKQKKCSKEEQQMKRFHNTVVKDYVFKTLFHGAPNAYHYEIAGGQGGDLWRLNKYCESSILFLDIDRLALEEAKKRYLTSFKKDLRTYQFDLNDNDDMKDLLYDYPLPSTISCQFAAHYFFDSFVAFCNNLDVGGRCAFTIMDKDKVLELLNGQSSIEIKVKNKIVFSIAHQVQNRYNVFINTIGKTHSEKLYSKKDVFTAFQNFKVIDEFNFADRFPDQTHPLVKVSALYHAYILEKDYSLNNNDYDYSDISDDDYF